MGTAILEKMYGLDGLDESEGWDGSNRWDGADGSDESEGWNGSIGFFGSHGSNVLNLSNLWSFF